MAGQCGAVHHDNPITDLGIMRDMTACHKQPIIPNFSHTAATIGTGIHRHMFPNTIALTDHKSCFFAIKLEILRNFANHRKRKNHRVLTNCRLSRDHNVTF